MARKEACRVIQFLEYGVDKVALGIEQEDVVVVPFGHKFPNPGVVFLMSGGVA